MGSLRVRGLSLADKVVDITDPSSAAVVREGEQNVSAGWHPGQGVYHLSTRTLRDSQLQGLENQRLVIPAFAAVSSSCLSSSEAPSTVTPPSFLFHLFSPFAPPPCVWPPALSLRPDPPVCSLPDLPAASPSQAAAPASPAPLAAAAICPPGSRPPGTARQNAAGEALSSGVAESRSRWEVGCPPGAAAASSAPSPPRRTRSGAERHWMLLCYFTSQRGVCGEGVGEKHHGPGSSETRVG